MKITNKVKRPLSIPLPDGKKLYLAIGKSGEITTRSATHPALVKMIESGEVEVTGGKRGAAIGGSPHVSTGSGASKGRRTTMNKGGNRSS